MMEEVKKPLLTPRQIGMAAAFGGAALAIVLAGITFPIPGTVVVTDPREPFTTIGSALTGPIGGLVIGFLAGIAEPGIPLASLLAHIVGCLYMGFAYKKLVYTRLGALWMKLVGWAILVLIYYFVVVVPLFVVGIWIFYPAETGGEAFLTLLGVLEVGAVPEAVLTTIFTTIIMGIIPERLRRPVW
jgi:hypothetical protein